MIRENLSDKDMYDHFITMICAGHDTTAYFASYLSFLLATHPQVQQRVWEEVKERVGVSGVRR
jgi:cytochrome P450